MKRLAILFAVMISLGSVIGTLCAVHRPPEQVAVTRASIPLENLLPADPVLYMNWDGLQLHEVSWKQTVAHDALVESGLSPAMLQTINALSKMGGPQGEAIVGSVLTQGIQKGFSTCVKFHETDGPFPTAYLGLREGAELYNLVSGLLNEAFEGEVQQGEAYSWVEIPETPGLQLGWMNQDGHLLMIFGPELTTKVSALKEDGYKTVKQSVNWNRMSSSDDFEVCSSIWFDFQQLAALFSGVPLPIPSPTGEPLTAGDVLQRLGLDNLQYVSLKSGFQGEALWTEFEVEAPGEPKGLLSGLQTESMTLSDVPPLPAKTSYFHVGTSDWLAGFQALRGIYDSATEVAPPGSLPPSDFGHDFAREILGFDVPNDLLAALGKRYTIFVDDSQSTFLFPSIGFMVEVNNSDLLLQTLATSVEKIREMVPGNMVQVEILQKRDRHFGIVNFAGGAFSLSIAMDENWLIAGLSPQTVDATLLRIDGDLPSWKPNEEWRASFQNLPQEFTSLSTMDVRQGYQTIAVVMPFLINMAKGMTRFAPPGQAPDLDGVVSAADFPPSELVTHKLFPAITVGQKTENGMKWISRSSAPGISASGAASMTASPILIALLLPAIQSARDAARRSSSKNNMKMLGLAMHNFHDTYRHLPAGTGSIKGDEEAIAKLTPEQRLSWIVSLLPYLEQAALYNQINHNEGWKSEKNQQLASIALPILQNPGMSFNEEKFPATHYIAIAGIGKDAPELKLPHKRAGFFGYERKTRFADVHDGLSNTMMITEASDKLGPWAAGGQATIRSLTQKPYINGPDGIGSPFNGGLHVLMGDGSVRFVSEEIDPSVFEALSTIAGGEVIPNF